MEVNMTDFPAKPNEIAAMSLGDNQAWHRSRSVAFGNGATGHGDGDIKSACVKHQMDRGSHRELSYKLSYIIPKTNGGITVMFTVLSGLCVSGLASFVEFVL